MRMISKWVLAAGAAACFFAGTQASQAQQTIRVGWTIPAEESKYWMMRRPQEFPDLGKTYNIEWTQFQGTAPMTQALAAGALDCATQAPLSLCIPRIHSRAGAIDARKSFLAPPCGPAACARSIAITTTAVSSTSG